MEENKRNFFRVPLKHSLCGRLKMIDCGGTYPVLKQVFPVCIFNIGPGGASFETSANLDVSNLIIYLFRTVLFFEKVEIIGKIVWKKKIEENKYRYGLEFSVNETDRSFVTNKTNILSVKIRKTLTPDGCSFCNDNCKNI